MTPLGKKQQQKVVAVVVQWLQLRTDYFTNQMRLCMRSFVPIFFSWEIFSFSPTVNCNAVGQYKMLTKGDLLGSFCSFSTPPNPLLSNTHYICRQRMHNLIWFVEQSVRSCSHCTTYATTFCYCFLPRGVIRRDPLYYKCVLRFSIEKRILSLENWKAHCYLTRALQYTRLLLIAAQLRCLIG